MFNEKQIEWRDYLTAEEAIQVAESEQSRRDATDNIKTIRNRCYQRARRMK